nr:H511 [uncultured bacterium]
MQLTPALKVAIITFAFMTSIAMLIWTSIKTNALALNLNEHLFNIILVVIVMLDKGASALLVYLGLRAPTIGEEVRDIEE